MENSNSIYPLEIARNHLKFSKPCEEKIARIDPIDKVLIITSIIFFMAGSIQSNEKWVLILIAIFAGLGAISINLLKIRKSINEILKGF